MAKNKYDVIISVQDKDGNVIKIKRTDKLRLTSPANVEQLIEKFKEKYIKEFTNNKEPLDKMYNVLIPSGFKKVGAYLVHPSGYVIDEKWNKVPLLRDVETGDIYYKNEHGQHIHLIEVLVGNFDYTRELLDVFKVEDYMGVKYLHVDRKSIHKSARIPKSSMRQYDIYIYDNLLYREVQVHTGERTATI